MAAAFGGTATERQMILTNPLRTLIRPLIWRHQQLAGCGSCPVQPAGLSTCAAICEATRSRPAADLETPKDSNPKSRVRKVASSSSKSSSGSKQAEGKRSNKSLRSSTPKRGKAEQGRKSEAQKAAVQHQELSPLPPPPEEPLVPSLHIHLNRAAHPAAAPRAPFALTTAAPWEVLASRGAAAPSTPMASSRIAFSTSLGGAGPAANIAACAGLDKASSSSSGSGVSGGSSSSKPAHACMPPQVTPPPFSSTRSSTSSGLLGSAAATPSISLWGLPGMAPGSAAADMHALLGAIQPLPASDVYALVAEMHGPLYKPMQAGVHRVFLCDTEHSTYYAGAQARVVDVCVVDVATGDKFSTLVNPMEWIPPPASHIHGITNHTVRHAPCGPHVWLALMLWLHQRCTQTPGGAPALFVAHNVNTDTKSIGVEFARAGLMYPNTWAELCTLSMARQLVRGVRSYKLEHLAPHFGLGTSALQLHRAEADCDLLQDVVDAMLARSFGRGSHLVQSVALSEDERLARSIQIRQINMTNRFTSILAALDKLQPPLGAFVYNRYAAATRAAGLEPVSFPCSTPKEGRKSSSGSSSSGGGGGGDVGGGRSSNGSKASPTSGRRRAPAAEALMPQHEVPRQPSSKRSGVPCASTPTEDVHNMGGWKAVPDVQTGRGGPSEEGELSPHALQLRQLQQQVLQLQQQLQQQPQQEGQEMGGLQAQPLHQLEQQLEQQQQQQQQHHHHHHHHQQQQQQQQPEPQKMKVQGEPQLQHQLEEQPLKEQRLQHRPEEQLLKDLQLQHQLEQPLKEQRPLGKKKQGERGRQQAPKRQGQEVQEQQHLDPSQQPSHPAPGQHESPQQPSNLVALAQASAAHDGAVLDCAAMEGGRSFVWASAAEAGHEQHPALEVSGSERWREADPLADIEAAFDEQALSDLGSTSPGSADLGSMSLEAHAQVDGSAAPTTTSTLVPSPSDQPPESAAPVKAPKSAKPPQASPVWSYLAEPPYQKRMPTKKWFTAGQLKKLEQSELTTLLSVLSHYPRAYKAFTPVVQPHLQEQCVDVVATVLESQVTSIRGKGQAVLSMLVEAPLGMQPSLLLLSSSSGGSGGGGSGGSIAGGTGDNGGKESAPGTTIISVTKFAAGGMWAGRALEGLQRSLGDQIVLKASLEAVNLEEQAECLKWLKKKRDDPRPQPQWRTTGTPDMLPLLPGAMPRTQRGSQKQGQEEGQAAAGGAAAGGDGWALVEPDPEYVLEPVYPARSPLKPDDFFSTRPSKEGKDILWRALKGLAGLAQDTPPEDFEPLAGLPGLEALQLMRWIDALHAVHRPHTLAAVNAGRRQLAFQEMFFMQLELLQRRRAFLRRMARIAPTAHIADMRAIDALRKGGASRGLPFTLTGAQERALVEITEDMRRPVAMLRLLQGDVGSGKTIVAMLAMLAAAGSGYQALLLVPTGILAHQHLHTLQGLVSRLPPKLQKDFGDIVLLSGGLKAREKRSAVAALQSGASRLVVSTHSALFTSDWRQLGLVVIDEQHKFGVRQKEGVLELCKHYQPHILSMSATPIPRTMALVKYGEMVVSALYESPPHRQQVATTVVADDAAGRAVVQDAIKTELAAGGRAFIVYPLRSALSAADAKRAEGGEVEVEEGDLRSATAEFQRLQKQKVFGTDKCVLLHGGMKLEDKAAAVDAFRSGQRPVMVCTTVVEVGVDVSQASIIVVEHADRFGLAQLHQLRGRVGRGVLTSRCLLLAPSANIVAAERLKVMESCHNGLDIAEADLQLRGAGSVFNAGIKQSGGVDCTDLCSQEVAKDPRIVEVARALAANTLLHTGGLSPQLQRVAAAHQATRAGVGRGQEDQLAGGFAV